MREWVSISPFGRDCAAGDGATTDLTPLTGGSRLELRIDDTRFRRCGEASWRTTREGTTR